MAYEYEKVIKEEMPFSGISQELQEVYRKAKAFNRIVEIYSDNDHYSDEYVMETIQEQIDLMEGADDGN